MKPEVLIVVSSGVVEDVQANLPGIEVTINDTDQQEVGEPYTSTFKAWPWPVFLDDLTIT